MKNRMSDLRNHLFETLEALKDEEKPMALDRAKAISEVAQTIINTAKTEIALLEVIGANTASEFFDAPQAFAPSTRPSLQILGQAAQPKTGSQG